MIDIVILNRNLRMLDNAALYYGSKHSNYIVIYLYDETYWNGNGKSLRQLKFSNDCLNELNNNLIKINSEVLVFAGSFTELNLWIKKNYTDYLIHINHCTDIKYFRDEYKKFYLANKNNIKIYNDFGLQLNNFDRDIWSLNWNKIMNEKLHKLPKTQKHQHKTNLVNADIFLKRFKNSFTDLTNIQKGGTKIANQLLNSFINSRCERYRTNMSSPVLSEEGCSRLSPHFAYGSISIRQVYQKLNESIPHSPNKVDLFSFKKRLYWHCHFIQKLHTEPQIEYQSMHRMCDSLRPIHNDELIDKWINGETGFPFLDACMKYLKINGWINFRMRAMIMSFASYNLWQPWQKTSPLLAQLFTDYEPGIHISQVQMQSGVTGINLPRIYSVVKQGKDHDPDALWIKNLLPTLKDLEPKLIHEGNIEELYMPQITNLKESSSLARERIWNIRKDAEFKALSSEVYLKHGSRKRRVKNKSV
jgi:deoxyribodipyrimidine photo-lyase